ncbi:MAG TPA: Rieske 2Fe-2S domain-containing protein [Candidatus Binatia bacterium]|nr:Rieske 2Fe-2S domain-containing protein [Candidatus Binatia bacterium]
MSTERPSGEPASAGDDATPIAAPFEPVVATIPLGLLAIGARTAPFEAALPTAELAPGAMRRVTFGDLDVLVAWTSEGIVAIDDRCPHMSAPLSLGRLDGCLIDCPLHSGQFDLATGLPTRMPTTGGLDADGTYHPTWSPPGKEPKPDPPGSKTEARRLTRVRRIRYYPVRIHDGLIEVAIPRE